jgi:hypothetical protein
MQLKFMLMKILKTNLETKGSICATLTTNYKVLKMWKVNNKYNWSIKHLIESLNP